MFAGFVFAQSGEINIIPKPASVERGSGHFQLDRKTKIVATDEIGRKMASLLNDILMNSYGFKLRIASKSPTANYIQFLPPLYAIQETTIPGRPNMLHTIAVQPQRIQISGYEQGQFYGLQTLRQLLPIVFKGSVQIPVLVIADHPRFRYRGMHLDVSRHFMPVSFVKKYIDLMSQYKFNTFHWHLTDDQGWRIEIKKWPKLTEIGSKRPETVKERNLTPYIGDGIPVEGFYTQGEIKDVVAYAKARYITVIPEIELPGHSSAALAAYPELGCKENYQYKVQTTWGIFKEVFCPTEKTFQFLEDVLTETIALFPDSPYIHIGGDEVLKDHWKESAFVQELKQKLNLKDEHEVQSYFIQRMEKFINSKGKKIIGWDEILEGGLAPNATVMSWRGMKGGIEAAKAKHDVIMTPTDFVYFDYGQGDPAYEPLNIGSYVPLEKVYSFDPVPTELTADEAKYIIGGQANIWTEYIKTPSHVEYMAFPRVLALSEVLWSRPEDKNFLDFGWRLAKHLPRLDKQQVNYRIPEPLGLRNTVVEEGDKVRVDLMPRVEGARIFYTLDGTTPDETSPVFDRPLEVGLKENERLDLKTIVVLPGGRKSSVYAATFLRRNYMQPVELTEKRPCVTYAFMAPAADSASTLLSGETRALGFQQFAKAADLKQPFSVMYDGYFNAPSDGIYEFQIDSIWDAAFVIGGETLIDDKGDATRKVRSAIVPLKAGPHKISLRYDHRGGDAAFRFRWGIKGQGLRQAYGGEFVH